MDKVEDLANIWYARYGDEKPASEMLFSYGFLDSGMTEARAIVLRLNIPEDDPMGLAKKMFCQEAPGLRISAVEGSEEVAWESELAWMACVNEDDGLHFGIAQTTDGGQELEAIWKGKKIESASCLRELLAVDPLWDIFQLRAAVLLLERLETQLALLQATEIPSNLLKDQAAIDSMFRPGIFASIAQLRSLEGELLERALEGLIKQVSLSGCLKDPFLSYFPPLTMTRRDLSYWVLQRWPIISWPKQGGRPNPKTFHECESPDFVDGSEAQTPAYRLNSQIISLRMCSSIRSIPKYPPPAQSRWPAGCSQPSPRQIISKKVGSPTAPSASNYSMCRRD